MESKVPNVEFDKDKIDAESRTNLSSDLFDSKQREIDLAIKKQNSSFCLSRIYLYVEELYCPGLPSFGQYAL